MLLQFSVKNHKSIKEKATISTVATKDSSLRECVISPDNKRELLPVLALYGANAAGKSNLLYALLLMQDMVAGENAKPLKDTQLPQEPFAFTEDEEEATEFEIIYYYEGIKYAYAFAFNRNQIISECLYHWPNGREALVFSRENGKYEFRENVNEQMTLAGRTPENRLYLVTSNEWNLPQTAKAYLWFTRKLSGLYGDKSSIEVTLNEMAQGKDRKNQILRELLVADLGIVDVEVSGKKDDRTIRTKHRLITAEGKEKTYSLLLSQESQGTQNFFSRIGSWLKVLNEGGVLVVDEIEASMHPLLTRHLIEAMQDKEINTNHAQLIFTTHDTGLLDLHLLRRDQIWFAEKDERTAETDIYPLTDFSPRKGENISKGYLQGRYGAIPFIDGGAAWEE